MLTEDEDIRLELFYHRQAQVEERRPSKGVGQAVDELDQNQGDLLAQGKVGHQAHNHHEHDGVLQHLEGRRAMVVIGEEEERGYRS